MSVQFAMGALAVVGMALSVVGVVTNLRRVSSSRGPSLLAGRLQLAGLALIMAALGGTTLIAATALRDPIATGVAAVLVTVPTVLLLFVASRLKIQK